MAIHISTLNGGDITITTDGSAPSGHPETRFTLQGGTVETANITGTLGMTWMENNGYFESGEWVKEITQVDIGNTVTSIGLGAFLMNSSLTNVTIDNNVTSIEDAFFGCTGLTSVTFEGKDRTTVQGMSNYPFSLNYANESGVTIHCTDGDIQVPYEG